MGFKKIRVKKCIYNPCYIDNTFKFLSRPYNITHAYSILRSNLQYIPDYF